MRVLVTGGRHYQDRETVHKTLDGLGITELAEGGASGADLIAHYWAKHHGVPVRTYPANWLTHGKAAGPIRNQQMLDDFKPDLVVAFPGGKGTAHMVSVARKAGVPVTQVDPAS